MNGVEYRPIKLWVCDHCAEFAEDEPGATCETCCEGTVRAVGYVPADQSVRVFVRIRDLLGGTAQRLVVAQVAAAHRMASDAADHLGDESHSGRSDA
jgi:hypothetical protein